MRERRAGMSQGQRHGVCHRCGWSGVVSRVGLQERRKLGTGMAFGRLCGDCVNVLTSGPQVQVGVPSQPSLQPIRHSRFA
jgi:hypothetical protein